MDEMIINSKIMKWFICKYIKKSVKKKYGADIDVQLNKFAFKADDNETNIHLDVALKANSQDFSRILKSIADK